jgi:hypothetical protein
MLHIEEISEKTENDTDYERRHGYCAARYKVNKNTGKGNEITEGIHSSVNEPEWGE